MVLFFQGPGEGEIGTLGPLVGRSFLVWILHYDARTNLENLQRATFNVQLQTIA